MSKQISSVSALIGIVAVLVAIAGCDMVGQQKTYSPKESKLPPNERYILKPKAPDAPRINGAKVFGVRPGNPFLFTIPATGKRPMTFAADNLPQGLTIDSNTGLITGRLTTPGTYNVTLKAQNARGKAKREFRIIVGNTLALTPPMGWNSWYCFFDSVTDEMMRAAADAMVNTGMINHGYCYVNIDDGWAMKPGSDNPRLNGPARDLNGMVNANKKFPDMKALTDYIHSKGLKAGIYTSPGPLTCAGYVSSYQYEESDAQRFAQWGFDFLKYDWCSYSQIAKDRSRDELKKPYILMKTALDKQNRDFIYNLCQYGMGNVWEWGAEVGGHCWRTTGDLGLEAGGRFLPAFFRIGLRNAKYWEHAKPGGWNDPDYIMIGWVGDAHKFDTPPKQTVLTPDEQYSYMSMWCLMAAPLIFSGDMTKLDEFTLSILTNDEVIEVDQDPLGRQAPRVAHNSYTQVWAKDMEDGSKAVGFFNIGEEPNAVKVTWRQLGVTGNQVVRDLWRQKNIGTYKDGFEAVVRPHGVILIKITPAIKQQI